MKQRTLLSMLAVLGLVAILPLVTTARARPHRKSRCTASPTTW